MSDFSFCFYEGQFCAMVRFFVFCVFSVCCCLERLVSEMTCCVSSLKLNSTHSLIHSLLRPELMASACSVGQNCSSGSETALPYTLTSCLWFMLNAWLCAPYKFSYYYYYYYYYCIDIKNV